MPATPAGTRRSQGAEGTAADQAPVRGARPPAASDNRTRRMVVLGTIVAAALFTIGGVLLASRGGGSTRPTATTRRRLSPWSTPDDPQTRARAAGLAMGAMAGPSITTRG